MLEAILKNVHDLRADMEHVESMVRDAGYKGKGKGRARQLENDV